MLRGIGTTHLLYPALPFVLRGQNSPAQSSPWLLEDNYYPQHAEGRELLPSLRSQLVQNAVKLMITSCILLTSFCCDLELFGPLFSPAASDSTDHRVLRGFRSPRRPHQSTVKPSLFPNIPLVQSSHLALDHFYHLTTLCILYIVVFSVASSSLS